MLYHILKSGISSDALKRNKMIYHVYPNNDLKPHNTEDTTCECDPTIKTEDGNMIVVHNSYDGREAVENANEILDS